MKKFDAFQKSLEILKKSSIEKSKQDEIYRMGIVGQFNLTFELAWKSLREVLIFHGVEEVKIGSPRATIKTGYKFYFFDDEEIWLEMLESRNVAIHIYSDEKKISELVEKIFAEFIPALSRFVEKLKFQINF